MSDTVEIGALVLYHGSMKNCHGLAFVDGATNEGTRYTLRPFAYIHYGERSNGRFVDGVNAGILYCVRRESFTVVGLPELPEFKLEPGLYKHVEDGKTEKYVLDNEGKWSWFNSEFHNWEPIDTPVYGLRALEEM